MPTEDQMTVNERAIHISNSKKYTLATFNMMIGSIDTHTVILDN